MKYSNTRNVQASTVHSTCAECPDDCTNWVCIEQCPCVDCADERVHLAPGEVATLVVVDCDSPDPGVYAVAVADAILNLDPVTTQLRHP